jgi:hypothetical protein
VAASTITVRVEVGDEADFVHGSMVRELHAQRQWIACGARLLRKSGDDVVGMDELHVALRDCNVVIEDGLD